MTGSGIRGPGSGLPKPADERYIIVGKRITPPPTAWIPVPPGQRQLDHAARTAERRARDQAREQQERDAARRREAEEQREREREQQLELARERARQQAIARLQHQRASDNVDAMLNYHRGFGRQWMAERGVAGLAGTMRPIAKVGGKVLSGYLDLTGALSPSPLLGVAATVAAGQVDKAVQEINDYEAFLAAQAPKPVTEDWGIESTPEATQSDLPLHDVSQYEIRVMGSVITQDKVVTEIGKSFARRIAKVQSEHPQWTRSKVSTEAHRLVQQVDMPRICRKFRIPAGRVVVEPLAGTTGPRGGQVRYDVGILGRRAALIELKASDYTTARTEWQLQAHQIGVREETATHGRPGDYYRITADPQRPGAHGKIQKWSGEDMQRQLRAKRTPPRFKMKTVPGARPVRVR